jgi:hypothetical protein
MSEMTDEQFRKTCEFYHITVEEGMRRRQACIDQADDPEDPICVGCAKRPHEIPEYIDAVMWNAADATVKLTQEDFEKMAVTYVIEEEGTYNQENGHFFCTYCYIKNGEPSKPFPDRWICP